MVIILAGISIICISSCQMHLDYRISKAITEGQDPVKARLAFENTRDNESVIVSLMNKE